MNRLTIKQKKFVDAYVNNGGNGVEAIRAAWPQVAQIIAPEFKRQKT